MKIGTIRRKKSPQIFENLQGFHISYLFLNKKRLSCHFLRLLHAHKLDQCRNDRLPVKDSLSFEQAQVCSGGVDTSEVQSKTMESRLHKGLYFAGELLDIDGTCGGYNLQWAWSSGATAGIWAAKEE